MASKEQFCTTCYNDKKRVAAVSFCADCKIYFCKSCLRDHNKFPTLKGHKLLDKAMMKSTNAMKSSTKRDTVTHEETTDTCSSHHGNKIEMYCTDHGATCCTVCVSIDHRSCSKVSSIAMVAKGIFRSPERLACKTSLDKTRRTLEQLKTLKTKELSDLNTKQNEIVKQIGELKKRLFAILEKLEKESILEVNVKHKIVADQLATDINSLDHMLKSAEQHLKNIDKFKGDNESQFFLHVKNGQRCEAVCLEFIEHLQCSTDLDHLSFDLNTDIESYLNQIESFNCKKKSTRAVRVFDVRIKQDKAVCDIRSACILNNEHVILADHRNDNLKRLDTNYKVVEVLSLPGGPFGVCSVGEMELAVTLLSRERVQLIKVGKQMTAGKSFSVERRCKGICYCLGELYVCCGGGYNEGGGHIRIFNLQGLLLRTLQRDKTGQSLISPVQIDSSLDGSRLYVADKEGGVFVIDRLGHNIAMISDILLEDVSCVCVGDHGLLFIGCSNSHSVLKLERDSNFIEKIFNSSDGIKYPQSITSLLGNKVVLITCKESSKMHVFKTK